jgi:hypothetical protein
MTESYKIQEFSITFPPTLLLPPFFAYAHTHTTETNELCVYAADSL